MSDWCSFITLVLFMLVFAIGGDLVPICTERENDTQEEQFLSDNILYLFPDDNDEEVCEAFLEESQVVISMPKRLPQGWQWQDYDDGSGGLYAPDGTSVISYDLSPYFNQGGIEYQDKSSAAGWQIFWGSLDEFRSFCECKISLEVIAR